jgi:opacity protein-like surface antigen
MKKLLIAAAALAVTAAPIAASAAPFGFGGRGEVVRVHDNGFRGNGFRGGRWDGGYNDGRGAAVAAGLFGLVLGAAIANDHPYYAQRCGWETQAYPGPYGTVQYEQVQVCR